MSKPEGLGLNADLQEMVKKQVVEAMNSTHNETTENEASNDVVKKLDENEVLRIENLVMREQLEKQQVEMENMRRELSSRDIANIREQLQIYLYKKHNINPDKHNILIDAQKGTLTVKPKSVTTK